MIETLREIVRAEPFQAFDIVLVDGRRFTIRHPDWISIPPVKRSHVFFIFETIEGNDEDFKTHRVNSSLVLEVVTPEQPAQS